MKIYVTSGVEIGELPTDQISCVFEKTSFDLKIHNLKGKNFRLKIQDLCENIKPNESKYQIKSNGVSITLVKENQTETWGGLKKIKSVVTPSLEKTIKADTDEADPLGSMQNMLKEMY